VPLDPGIVAIAHQLPQLRSLDVRGSGLAPEVVQLLERPGLSVKSGALEAAVAADKDAAAPTPEAAPTPAPGP
jgi:hypothetical protein